MTDTAELRREMSETRDRMSRDIDEIQARASDVVQGAKQRLDVSRLVREHPWSALGVAVALGAVVGGSGADKKAARATAEGAKKAAQASGEAVAGLIDKLHSPDDTEGKPVEREEAERGLGDRLFGALGGSVAGGLDRLLDELRVASREWAHRRSARPAAAMATVAAAAVAVRETVVATTSPADEVPVPNEMMPTEVDLRADTVEALGGGTHEPPLAPGAGDLGARWS